MISNNPLRIFTEDQLQGLNHLRLKGLKREILLEFQISNETTIKLNGIYVDKNGVLEIFEELKERLPLHLFIHKNTSLKTFLYFGDKSIFQDEKTIESVKNYHQFKKELDFKISECLKTMIKDVLMNRKAYKKELVQIDNFIIHINPDFEQQVYFPAYEAMKNRLDDLEEKYKTPFAEKGKLRFYSALRDSVNVELYEKLAVLPEIFEPLKYRYCKWCNNAIVFEALNYESRIALFPRDSLYTIRDAAKIASNHVNSHENLQVVKTIQSHLRGESSSSGSSGPSAWGVLVFIFLMVKMFILIGKCSNDSSRSSRYTDRYGFNKTSILSEHDRDLLKRSLIHQKNTYQAREKSVMLDFAGEKKNSITPILTKTKEYKDHTELTYKVDMLPSRNTYLNQLVPEEIMDKHRGKHWPIVFNFQMRKIKNTKFSHRILLDLKNNKRIAPQQYQHKTAAGAEDIYLSLKTIPKANYPLNGTIEKLDVKTGGILDGASFSIKELSSGSYQVKIQDTGEKINISKSYVENLDSTQVVDQKSRFAALLRNLTMINRKYLKQGSLYTLDKVSAYSIIPSEKAEANVDKIILDKGTIKFGFVSEEDNTAYVGLRSKKANIKYYADFSTGILKGMSMITTSEKNTEIESITLFSSS